MSESREQGLACPIRTPKVENQEDHTILEGRGDTNGEGIVAQPGTVLFFQVVMGLFPRVGLSHMDGIVVLRVSEGPNVCVP